MVDPDVAACVLRDWLLTERKRIRETGAFDEALVERLRAEGLPIVRFIMGVPSLHPQVDSFPTLRQAGKGLTFREYRLADPGERTADPRNAEHLQTNFDALANSPLRIAYSEGRAVRCRLEGPPEEGEFGILADLRAAGLTDYLVMPIPFSDGSHKALTFATDRPGGYTDAEGAAARRALTAATAFLGAVADLNAARKAARRPEFACGVALHFGGVFYGNVGGPDRLDFTVIGPAVNLARRIEGLTRELGRPILVSAPFATLHGGAFETLGDFALKGVAERHAIYAPAA
jgi:hypothetical protein